MKNYSYLIAGAICLFTAILHTVGGQLSLVDPMLISDLTAGAKTEWLGAWHMITILLWMFGYILFRNGLKLQKENTTTIRLIAFLCLCFAASFIAASLWRMHHAPQYILFLPIAILTYFGLKKQQKANA